MGDLLKMHLRDKLMHLKIYCTEKGACERCAYKRKNAVQGNECDWMELKLSEAPEYWNVERMVDLIDSIDRTID